VARPGPAPGGGAEHGHGDPPELSLRPGDLVTIAITGLGELANPVELVDTSPRLSR
jgi:2-keto-4-pentenoate hydratase/2-oxohepta-3-ene-1,7-dioic acid hydratase in catechol pathway